jgi:hypothetical protein
VNRGLAEKVADAVLYEGYMLYPYRPSSIKNRQRWSFGILYPPAYDEVRRGTERSIMRSECLLRAAGDASLQIRLRFLQLVAAPASQSIQELPPAASAQGAPLDSQDCVERSVEFEVAAWAPSARLEFSFPASAAPSAGADALHPPGVPEELAGSITFSAHHLSAGALKLAIEIANRSPLSDARDRDSVLLQSMLSAHIILAAEGGEFVSLLDPPEALRAAAAACVNVGNFPVLVGEPGERGMLLCSPILLYDYPQVAPESAGDFYDATEMDEMLTLRVMTLADAEKDEVRLAGERVRNLLQRTERSTREQLARTHGAIRSLRPADEDN